MRYWLGLGTFDFDTRTPVAPAKSELGLALAATAATVGIAVVAAIFGIVETVVPALLFAVAIASIDLALVATVGIVRMWHHLESLIPEAPMLAISEDEEGRTLDTRAC